MPNTFQVTTASQEKNKTKHHLSMIWNLYPLECLKIHAEACMPNLTSIFQNDQGEERGQRHTNGTSNTPDEKHYMNKLVICIWNHVLDILDKTKKQTKKGGNFPSSCLINYHLFTGLPCSYSKRSKHTSFRLISSKPWKTEITITHRWSMLSESIWGEQQWIFIN